MTAIFRRLWAFVVVFVYARRNNGEPRNHAPIPPGPKSRLSRTPPPFDDRFGYGYDLAPLDGAHSSVAEQRPFKSRVEGSTPSARTSESPDAATFIGCVSNPDPVSRETDQPVDPFDLWKPNRKMRRASAAAGRASANPARVKKVKSQETAQKPQSPQQPSQTSETSEPQTAADIDAKMIPAWLPRTPAADTDFHVNGEHYFKDTILEQLDYYHDSLKRFRKDNPSYYELFSRVGVNLIPDRYFLNEVNREQRGPRDALKAEPWFAQRLPAHGAVCWGTSQRVREAEQHWMQQDHEKNPKKKTAWVFPRFFYFTRFAKRGCSPQIQPAWKDLTVYVVGAYFDFHASSCGWRSDCEEMAIGVAPDGELVPLKIRHEEWVTLPKSKRPEIKRHTGGFCRQVWGFDPFMRKWAADHGRTPEEMICHLFCDAAEMHQALNSSMIRVGVKKDDIVAMVNVDIRRTPYFFDDRDVVIDERGVKQKIFHIVRPHDRHVGDKVQHVHMHFRGLREFIWNGHHVSITVPGRDHPDWAHAQMTAYDFDNDIAKKMLANGERFLEMKEIGRLVARTMRPERPHWLKFDGEKPLDFPTKPAPGDPSDMWTHD